MTTDQLTGRAPAERKPMGMMAWLATDGGRRCPQCGKFAKPDELGSIGERYVRPDGAAVIVSMYGHLPGRGCHKTEATHDQ